MHLASGGEVPLSPADKWGNGDREIEIKFTKEACDKAGTLDSMSPDQHINHKINVSSPPPSLAARLEWKAVFKWTYAFGVLFPEHFKSSITVGTPAYSTMAGSGNRDSMEPAPPQSHTHHRLCRHQTRAAVVGPGKKWKGRIIGETGKEKAAWWKNLTACLWSQISASLHQVLFHFQKKCFTILP